MSTSLGAEMTGRLETAVITEAPAPSLPGSQVLSKLGHELRSPLNGIIGLTRIMQMKLARDQIDVQEQLRQLEMVTASARQLLRTVDRVAEVARIEAAPPAPPGEAYDCRECVTVVLDELRLAAAHRDVALRAELPDRPVLVDVEHDALRRLLGELVGNAVRFAVSTVQVLIVDGADGPLILVSDDGPGMPPADQEAVFEAFHRGEEGARRDPGGVGLGLYLAKRLAVRCGAELQLRDSAQAGTTFTVHLHRSGDR